MPDSFAECHMSAFSKVHVSLIRLVAGLVACFNTLEFFGKSPSISVPAGYEIVEAAAPPLVKFPMLAAFDDRGRLFVAENAGVNLDDKALAEQAPSLIRVLEDDNGDGIFDRSTVFADRLTFPQGVLWHDGALYVASPPSLWRLTDEDGDGKADRRDELVTGFKFTGNAADVHGPFLHPNGRLYWTHGRKGHDVHAPGGALVSKGMGARVWSMKPDGSDVEVFAGGGLDNPVELAFSQEGDVFGTANLFLNPPRNDAIVHWVRGGVYPRADQANILNEFTRTGELLPAAALLGHVAPAGLTLIQPREGEGSLTLLHAEFNTRRIMRTTLEPNGASFRGRTEVFISSDTDGLHFTDVLQDADGSFLLVNTGAWFRIGCPTSGTARPDFRGAIYRVRGKNADTVKDPRGLEILWQQLKSSELVDFLGDSRPQVRNRAVNEFVRRGERATQLWEQATKDARYLVRSNAIWALTRIGTANAQNFVRPQLKSDDARLRQSACQSVGVTGDTTAIPLLMALLADPSPAVQREAATTIGLLRSGETGTALLAAAGKTDDEFLSHALVLAMIKTGDSKTLLKALDDQNTGSRRAALLALSEIKGVTLDAVRVLALLRTADDPLRGIVLSVAAKRADEPGWSEAALGAAEWAFADGADASRREVGARLLELFAGTGPMKAWLSRNLERLSAQGPDVLSSVIRVIGRNPKAWDEGWRGFLTASLNHDSPAVAEAALSAIVAHRQHGFDELLERLVEDPARPIAFRLAALQRPRSRRASLDANAFNLVEGLLRTGGSPETRVRAAAVLSESQLTQTQALAVASLLSAAGPLELPGLVQALTRGAADESIGQAVLTALRDAPSRWSLEPGTLQALFRRYPDPVASAALPMISEIMNQAVAKETRLSELENLLAGGDVVRGRQLLESGGVTCLACHRVGNSGGAIGPDLSTIGRIRNARDLLEAVAFPSATIARGYETFSITLKSGEVMMGTIPHEDVDWIGVITGGNAETRILRKDIRNVESSSASLMPSGLDRLLTSQQLADLIAYLQSLK